MTEIQFAKSAGDQFVLMERAFFVTITAVRFSGQGGGSHVSGLDGRIPAVDSFYPPVFVDNVQSVDIVPVGLLQECGHFLFQFLVLHLCFRQGSSGDHAGGNFLVEFRVGIEIVAFNRKASFCPAYKKEGQTGKPVAPFYFLQDGYFKHQPPACWLSTD